MTDDRWTERLSEYLDGELAPEERRELEGHLAQCAACQATLEELRAVVARAAALEDRPPATDLWPAVAQGIGAGEPGVVPLEPRRRRARRLAFTLPQLAAAAVALMAVSAGTVWLVGARAARPPVAMRGGTAPSGVVAPAVMTPGGYDAAVRDLERVLAQNRGRLDTATVHVLERNLQLIDSAIAECRRALAADPASPYLNAHLADTMQQKLELLRQAARLAART
jgi:anti-sigma factor RsiW